MKICFYDDFLLCEEKGIKYIYLNDDSIELYKLLVFLINNEQDLHFELCSRKMIAQKFYDILRNEFDECEL